ncbi:hypothetical protein RJT34_23403 [Clitoria ternatea]|uniref:Uncharacterized protein n=1 Tax=Clitoria ternatea TaxID=43366 RepID=A0AAN9FLJ9_CLITE
MTQNRNLDGPHQGLGIKTEQNRNRVGCEKKRTEQKDLSTEVADRDRREDLRLKKGVGFFSLESLSLRDFYLIEESHAVTGHHSPSPILVLNIN